MNGLTPPGHSPLYDTYSRFAKTGPNHGGRVMTKIWSSRHTMKAEQPVTRGKLGYSEANLSPVSLHWDHIPNSGTL